MHKIPAFPYCYFLFLCLILMGCSSKQTSGAGTDLTYSNFVHQLHQKGVSTSPTKALNTDFFSGTAYGLVIYSERISVFEYDTNAAMQNDANNISSDGSTIRNQNGGSAAVDWIAPPHFYKAGRLLVFYVGSNRYVTTLLQSILGSQFAGR